MTCRAATSATTCAGSSPTGAALSYDNEGRLASWQNAPGSSPTQSATYLSDGTGQRVQQVATANGTTTTTTSYIGSLEEVTSSGSTTTTTAYYDGLAESINSALSYLHSDSLGSVSEAVSTTSGERHAALRFVWRGTLSERHAVVHLSRVCGAWLKVACGGGGADGCGTIRPEASGAASADGMRHANATQAVIR